MNKPFPIFKWNESKHLCSQAWKSFTMFCIYATNKNWLLGLRPRSRWGSLQHSPIPPSWAAGHLPPAGLSQFHTNPASGSVYPTIHTCILSWLRHFMVESTYNMLCTKALTDRIGLYPKGQRIGFSFVTLTDC